MASKVETLFPTQILKGSLPKADALNKAILKDMAILSREDLAGQEWSKQNYRGGYTSYGSLVDLQLRSPAFSTFAEILHPYAVQFAKLQGWRLKGMKLELTALWMNIMPANTYHTLHFHPHSAISGAYYVTAPKDSVSLRLEDPRMSYYMNAPVREKASKAGGLYHEVVPTPGSFVLFESWLRHEVPPNRSKKDRISLSFNYSLNSL